jgi:hypothetical protein
LAFLLDKCTLQVFNTDISDFCEPFDCGNDDLNDFFLNDALNYQSQLLGKTYCFTLDENPKEIVCAFTISNDSIKTTFLPNARKQKVNKKIPSEKRMRTYPAVLIGRLGVNKKYRTLRNEEDRTGKQLMDFIKSWFIDGANKTGCRFIVVDSYNTESPLKYYTRNGFEKLFNTEEQEKEFTGLDKEAILKTRLMYFDLIVLKNESEIIIIKKSFWDNTLNYFKTLFKL